MPTEKRSADDRMNCNGNSAGATSNHDTMDLIDGELLLTKASKGDFKEQLQTKTVQHPRRRSSFLEEFALEDSDGLDDEDDQYVDIEQEMKHCPPPSSFDLSSPPRQVRRIAGGTTDGNRPNGTYASSSRHDVTRAVDVVDGAEPNRCHSLMDLNDVPTTENNGGRLPRRISFECHSSALLEGMVAGGEFADVFHSDSDSDSDTCSTVSSSDITGGSSGKSQQRRRRPSASSSPALARLGAAVTAATANGTSIRRTASTIGLRSSSSMISLASICEDANVREAPSLISKVDRYIINREIRQGSSIVRTQSELAMAQLAQQQQEEELSGPEGIVVDAASTVSTTFTRRGRRRSNRSYASTNDLPTAATTSA